MTRKALIVTACVLFVLLFVPVRADARSMFDVLWDWFEILCPVRHPFALVGWHGVHTVAAALVQWGAISATGAGVAVWMTRR